MLINNFLLFYYSYVYVIAKSKFFAEEDSINVRFYTEF